MSGLGGGATAFSSGGEVMVIFLIEAAAVNGDDVGG
jgi:hypothetical protein